MKTLAPNRLLSAPESLVGIRSRFHPFEQEVGSFIHKALECNISGETFDIQSLSTLIPQHKFLSAQISSEQMIEALEKEINSILDDTCWKTIKSLGEKAWSEQNIIHLDGDQLIRGSIDLLIRTNTGDFWVIDHKTTEEACHSSDLLGLATKHNYTAQIAAYVAAVKAMYPEAKVNGAIFYTAARKLCTTIEGFST
jgi:ATP-dependent exoDNAse (exonuclease V) beta subunit